MPANDHEGGQPDPITLKRALDQIRKDIARIPASELVDARGVDPGSAAGIVIGSLARIEKHRAALAAEFGPTRIGFLDRLPTAAYATLQASIELVAADPASDLGALHQQVVDAHSLLFTDASSLANRKLLDRERVEAGRPIQGYRTAVQSVLVLVTLLRASWGKIRSSTPLKMEDIDAAEAVAQRMVEKLSTRDQGASRAPEFDTRNRAFTNLVRVYGEVRRMLGFIRYWDGDADAIAPSLWSGRRRGRGGEVVTPDPDVNDPVVTDDPTPPAPAPAPAEPGMPGEPFVA